MTTDNDSVRAVDELAQFIRQIDGNHTMGAGALAERIVEWQASRERYVPRWIEISEEDMPERGEYLVQLSDGGFHVAKRHPNITSIGGRFEFDARPVVRWQRIATPNGGN